MGKMPKDWPAEFGKRARENLDLICAEGKNNVTQMILTLYALVIVPEERNLFQGVRDETREQMEADGWPIADWCWAYKSQQQGSPIHESGLRAFLRMLRHALAHGHISFRSDGKNISAVDFSHRHGENTLCGVWTADQLKTACDRLLSVIEEASEK